MVIKNLILYYFILFQLCCSGGNIFGFLANVSLTSLNFDHHLDCQLPAYVYVSGLLCVLCVSVFLKLPALVKLALMVIMSLTFTLTMMVTHPAIFQTFDQLTQ